MTDKKSGSIADRIFETIEEKILNGTFEKGEVLTELGLCEALSASRTPVREALARLKHEGLLEESAKGNVVAGISEEDLSDIYDIRLRIEGLAAAMCAEHITDEQLMQLEEVLTLQEFYTDKGSAESIKRLDSEFHVLIYTYCGSRTLSQLLGELHRKVQRYRRISVENHDRAEAAVKEHREIYEALVAHDAAKAEELSAKHIKNAKENILRQSAFRS